jgi:hypothetical protein
MVMNRFVDWCHLCGAIRVKRYMGVGKKTKVLTTRRVVMTEWISPPAKKKEAVAHLLPSGK